MEKILCGDALEVLQTLESGSVNCVITSPPYWALRDYGVLGQLGLEPHFDQYIEKLLQVFAEVRRVLRDDGTVWVNIGDTYSGNKEGKTDNLVAQYLKETTTALHKKAVIQEKSLCQIPSRFALAMTEAGWILRNEIIWHKPNAMPSSVEDRFTVDFEKVFFFVKSKSYYFNADAVRERAIYAFDNRGERPDIRRGTGMNSMNGSTGEFKNKRAVWTINTYPYGDAHFATFPEKLVEPMVMAGCPVGGLVLDPFSGAATTGIVAKKLGRNYLGIELNPEYVKISEERLAGQTAPLFT